MRIVGTCPSQWRMLYSASTNLYELVIFVVTTCKSYSSSINADDVESTLRRESLTRVWCSGDHFQQRVWGHDRTILLHLATATQTPRQVAHHVGILRTMCQMACSVDRRHKAESDVNHLGFETCPSFPGSQTR
jgi:hypothetical protein